MPIYEYQCIECSNRFDELVSHFSQKGSIKCPGCHSAKVEKLMSAFGFTSGTVTSASKESSSCNGCATKNCSTCH